MSDPYLDPQSGILRNKFGLNDQASLDRAEANAVALRSILLEGSPLKGDFDSQHLKQIHEYLFQDVYEWAGQFRTIAMVKADYVDGGRVTRFTSPHLIESELAAVFQHLAGDGFLFNSVYGAAQAAESAKLTEKAAGYYRQLVATCAGGIRPGPNLPMPENLFPPRPGTDQKIHQTSRRPSIALSMVISSVYSMSLPTGIPMAMRVTFTPDRFSC